MLAAFITLAGLIFCDASAVIGDTMVATILTLILAIPFAWAFRRSPANDRRRA